MYCSALIDTTFNSIYNDGYLFFFLDKTWHVTLTLTAPWSKGMSLSVWTVNCDSMKYLPDTFDFVFAK